MPTTHEKEGKLDRRNCEAVGCCCCCLLLLLLFAAEADMCPHVQEEWRVQVAVGFVLSELLCETCADQNRSGGHAANVKLLVTEYLTRNWQGNNDNIRFDDPRVEIIGKVGFDLCPHVQEEWCV